MSTPVRKTSLGMQAIGVTPAAPSSTEDDWRGAALNDRDDKAVGIVLTLLIHFGVLGGAVGMNYLDSGRPKKEEKYQTIEAGLAIKKKATAPKSKLPQKEEAPKVKPPDAPTIAKNPDVVPQPDKKKEKTPPKEAVDPNSVFEKYRHNQDVGTTAQTEDQEGSEYGTLDRAKGDPYVGELIGRMTADFVVPSVVSNTSLVTMGCVKIDDDGKIQDRTIDPEHKSGSHAFNSAVERRLKETTDMEKPVPNYLKKMLVGKFVCVPYTSKRE
jgi:hypothetical protein